MLFNAHCSIRSYISIIELVCNSEQRGKNIEAMGSDFERRANKKQGEREK